MDQLKRRVLITGGAGFVGAHLASRISEDRSAELVLVDNFARGRNDRTLAGLAGRSNVRLISGDLTDPRCYDQLGGEFDEVYHLAAVIGVKNVIERPHDVVRVNAQATLLLLDWFVKTGRGRFLFSSTSEAYAWTGAFHELPIPTPEDVPLALTDISNPRSSYAGSKVFGELAVTHYCQHYERPFAIVRYHNVYGPRMGYEHVIPELYCRARGGERPLVVYNTQHRRAFCFIDDAVTATIAAMRCEASAGETLNVGNDEEEVEIGDLARRILEASGLDVAIEARDADHDPITRRCPDISKARRLFDYQPQVSLDDGLKRTMDWYGRQIESRAA